MMYGSGEVFLYTECADCGCLQINAVPAELGKYYPQDYYSFSIGSTIKDKIRTRLKAARTRFLMTGRGFIGRLIARRFPDDRIETLKLVRLSPSEKILDIGCGSGELVFDLRSLGYSAFGADPFLKVDPNAQGDPILHKGTIHDVTGTFGLVMMHHSFEHLDEPTKVLLKTRELLAPGGQALIHIPTAQSYVWQHYRTNWVGLDAPRHLYLHTIKSMSILAEQAGLRIDKVVYSSGGGQFWQCEQRAKGVVLKHDVPYHSADIPKAERIANQRKADELNAQQLGDQVCFVLTAS
jgi:SAM-dependent methyltransferase